VASWLGLGWSASIGVGQILGPSLGWEGSAAYGERMARRKPEPVRITTAPRSHSDDIGTRQRRYLISMGVRTVCFVLAVVSIGHWFLWLFLAASFVLPYIAVVMANAGASTDPGHLDLVPPDPNRPALEGGPTPPTSGT
jgi:DUF3099 family protein